MMAAFAFLAIGIWNIHHEQSFKQNVLSFIGTFLTSLSFVAFTIVAIQRISWGTPSFSEGPIFILAALSMVLGIMLLGISIVRAEHYPSWTGISMILLMFMTLAVEIFGLPLFLQNVANMIISAILIYLVYHTLISRSESAIRQYVSG